MSVIDQLRPPEEVIGLPAGSAVDVGPEETKDQDRYSPNSLIIELGEAYLEFAAIRERHLPHTEIYTLTDRFNEPVLDKEGNPKIRVRRIETPLPAANLELVPSFFARYGEAIGPSEQESVMIEGRGWRAKPRLNRESGLEVSLAMNESGADDPRILVADVTRDDTTRRLVVIASDTAVGAYEAVTDEENPDSTQLIPARGSDLQADVLGFLHAEVRKYNDALHGRARLARTHIDTEGIEARNEALRRGQTPTPETAQSTPAPEGPEEEEPEIRARRRQRQQAGQHQHAPHEYVLAGVDDEDEDLGEAGGPAYSGPASETKPTGATSPEVVMLDIGNDGAVQRLLGAAAARLADAGVNGSGRIS